MHARLNLDKSLGEVMFDFVHNDLLPDLLRTRQNKVGREDMTMEELLKENGLKMICPRTIYNWLAALNFTYGARKRGYYVDGHEKPENVAY